MDDNLIVEKIHAAAFRLRREHPEYRRGQSYFNAAHDLYPDLASPLAGTDVDCYYIDANVDAFLRAVAGRCVV